jgi:hypothetical protein
MTQRVARSVTLLWAFVALSGVILALGGAVLGSLLTDALRAQALDDARMSLTQYTSGVVAPRLVYGSQLRVGSDLTSIIRNDLAERPDIVSVKVWRHDGTLAWASLDPERIGTRFPLSHDLVEVFETGDASAELEELDDAEDAAEASLPAHDLLEVYAPVVAGGETIGAYEVYADAAPLEASIAERKQVIWLTVLGVFAGLWLVLLVLARGASTTLRRQTTDLRERSIALSESYRKL